MKIVAISSVGMLMGCSDTSMLTDHFSDKPPVQAHHLYSPNGEPLNGGVLGLPSCEDALSHWFDRTDMNHDGMISREEFMADAQAQFHHMDIDGRGYLVSEALERFRRPYHQDDNVKETHDEPRDDRKDTRHENRRLKPQKEANGGFEDEGDPVMSADTNLDFQVTEDEFKIHAQKIFVELDHSHAGQLSRADVMLRCKKP
jgi:hypothetical protein